MKSRRRRQYRKRKKQEKAFLQLDEWAKEQRKNPFSLVSIFDILIDDIIEDRPYVDWGELPSSCITELPPSST